MHKIVIENLKQQIDKAFEKVEEFENHMGHFITQTDSLFIAHFLESFGIEYLNYYNVKSMEYFDKQLNKFPSPAGYLIEGDQDE